MSIILQQDAILDFYTSEIDTLSFIPTTNKSEIIASLNDLITVETRYEKGKIACELWKKMIKFALSDITSNIRGYDELVEYYDEFFKFEDVLFSIDEKFRDHVIHSIWVYLIGKFIWKKFNLMNPINYPGIRIMKGIDPKIINSSKDLLAVKKEAIWCLISLTHDLGYPIERTKNANEIMKKMINHFGFLELRDFNYNFTVLHQPLIEMLLNLLSLKALWVSEDAYYWVTDIGIKHDYAKSFERLDHGIMSAFLLTRYLDCVCDIGGVTNVGSNAFQNPESTIDKEIIITILNSISSHTNKNIYCSETDISTFNELLFLADELDEFSRFGKSIKTHEWTAIKCITEIDITSDNLFLKFSYDTKDFNYPILKFFSKKVKKINNRFEIGKTGIKEIQIICEDHTFSKPQTLKYLKNKTESIVDNCGKSLPLKQFLETV